MLHMFVVTECHILLFEFYTVYFGNRMSSLCRAYSSPLPVPGQAVWNNQRVPVPPDDVPLSKDVLIKHFLKQVFNYSAEFTCNFEL